MILQNKGNENWSTIAHELKRIGEKVFSWWRNLKFYGDFEGNGGVWKWWNDEMVEWRLLIFVNEWWWVRWCKEDCEKMMKMMNMVKNDD